MHTFYSYLTKLLEESPYIKTFGIDLSITTALNIADSQFHHKFDTSTAPPFF